MHRWNIQMNSWSWRKFSVVVLKESEKIKRQICLGEIHHCFLRGWELRRTTERAKFLKDLSPKFKVHFVCFYSIENCVLKWQNGRKTTASKLLTHRISAGCVSEFLQFWLPDRFLRKNFDTKLVNFFLKLVLPVILKEIQSIFLICTLRLLHKLSHNYHFTWHSFWGGVYSCSHSFPSKYLL